MFLNEQLKRDIDTINYVLLKLDANTDNRYRKDIEFLLNGLLSLNNKLNIELDLIQKLYKYKSYGFILDRYFLRRYDDFSFMVKSLNNLLYDLDELKKIVDAYKSLPKEKRNTQTAKKLESIMYDPINLKEVKSLWNKLK